MKVGIMQPYFFPYIGYWQLISAIDIFVIYDDVSYIKQGFINRNNILINGTKAYFTLHLRGASSNKLINEIKLGDNRNKLLKTVELNYKKAPYFLDVFPLIENIFNFKSELLIEFLSNSLKTVSKFLCLNTKFINSSEIAKDASLKGQDKLISICKVLGGTQYINPYGGQNLYDRNEFSTNGIELYFINSKPVAYPQFKNKFVPCLSIIDVMMFNSTEEIGRLLIEYELV